MWPASLFCFGSDRKQTPAQRIQGGDFNKGTTEERWAGLMKQDMSRNLESSNSGHLQKETWLSLSASGSHSGALLRTYGHGEKFLLPQSKKGIGRKFSNVFLLPASYLLQGLCLALDPMRSLPAREAQECSTAGAASRTQSPHPKNGGGRREQRITTAPTQSHPALK